MVTIRPARLPEDTPHLLAIDRAFTTGRVYRVARTPLSLTLEEVVAGPPVYKDFPLDAGSIAGYRGEQCLVAERDGAVVGFAALTHQRWNRRAEIDHLYVAPQHRGQGVGRALVAALLPIARAAGMRCLWLETSNLAYPAIQFYRRLGFALCGLDTSLYDPASPAGWETALYFARPLTPLS